MKLVWSPEVASKAYVETTESGGRITASSSISEMLSAMAGGWNAKLIVEAWCGSGETATSVGLAIAARHTDGRHVCMVPNEKSRAAYIAAMQISGVAVPEILIGGAKEVMGQLDGIDFLVVDSRYKDFYKVFKLAKLSHLGAVLVLKNAFNGNISTFNWSELIDSSRRVVKSMALPMDNGLQITHVGSLGGRNKDIEKSRKGRSWIKMIDHKSGEENIFRVRSGSHSDAIM